MQRLVSMKCSTATLIFLTFATSISLHAQTQPPLDQQPADEVLRVTTNLVTVPTIVRTRQGSYISNLRREDFLIYEDGVEQEISSFETVDKPFTVTLMLDVSDSTRIKLVDIQNAAIAFLNQLRPDDRALIVAFDKQFAVMTQATSDRKALADAIWRVKTGGGTALYDAMDTIINAPLKQIAGRRAIVILTDGIDTSSMRATLHSTLRSATEQSALIYPIQYDTPKDASAKQPDDQFNRVIHVTPSGESLSKAYERGTRYLQSIAEASGGRFQYSDNAKNLERSFARIAEELRQQYSLSYYPQNQTLKGGKRRIKVIVNVPNAVVHSRDSYAYKVDRR
jgi:Ca-activated chloride channel family protein